MALETSFLLVEADWPVARARHLAEALAPQWIVIHRVDSGGDLYYTFTYAEASLMLSAPADMSVHQAFDLHEQVLRAPQFGLGPRQRAHRIDQLGRAVRVPALIATVAVLVG